MSKKKFEGTHDRFLKDSTYRDSQLKVGRTEETCIAMDKIAQEDHSCCPLPEEFDRYRKNWYITLNKSGRNAPMKLRSDFLNQFTFINTKGGIRRLLHPVPRGGSGTNTGGAHKLKIVNYL